MEQDNHRRNGVKPVFKYENKLLTNKQYEVFMIIILLYNNSILVNHLF